MIPLLRVLSHGLCRVAFEVQNTGDWEEQDVSQKNMLARLTRRDMSSVVVNYAPTTELNPATGRVS